MPTTPKTPQDRKAPRADQDTARQVRFEDVDGHDLLIPFAKVDGIAQARLTQRLRALGDADEDGLNLDDLNLDDVADVIEYVRDQFAIDPDAFTTFISGRGGMERAMTLAFAFAGELGNDED